MNKKIISIDQGTTSSRAILFKNDFTLISIEQREFKQSFPNDGWVEHDPNEIWDSVFKVTKRLIEKNNLSPSDIASIGITNQRETTLIWDRETGEAIYPAIVWQDRRTADFCNNLKKDNIEALVQESTGLLIDPYFSASKICWLLDNVQGAREKAKKGKLAFGTVDSFLVWRLTEGKEHKTDVTNASRTMLYNIKENCWDKDLLDLFNIPFSILPEVCENVHDFGTTEIFGGRIGIGGVAGDQQAALIGQCCFKEGEAKSTYGTGCFILLNTGAEIITSENKLLSTIAYKIKGKTTYGIEGSIFIAGSAIQWLRDGLNFFEKASDCEELIKIRNKDSVVLVVPAFTGLGAPHWDPNARGAIYGLTRKSNKADITAATLESIAFQTKDLLDSMQKDGANFIELRIDGGMVENSWFSQCLTDTLDFPVLIPSIKETTALGSAFLAGMHAGLYTDFPFLEKYWSCKKKFNPNLNKGQGLRKKYSEWLQAVEKTKVS